MICAPHQSPNGHFEWCQLWADGVSGDNGSLEVRMWCVSHHHGVQCEVDEKAAKLNSIAGHGLNGVYQ